MGRALLIGLAKLAGISLEHIGQNYGQFWRFSGRLWSAVLTVLRWTRVQLLMCSICC